MKAVCLVHCLMALIFMVAWRPAMAQDDALVEKLRSEIARLKTQLSSKSGGVGSSSGGADDGSSSDGDIFALKSELLALKKDKTKLWKENIDLKKAAASGSGKGAAAAAADSGGSQGGRELFDADSASAELQKQLAEVEVLKRQLSGSSAGDALARAASAEQSLAKERKRAEQAEAELKKLTSTDTGKALATSEKARETLQAQLDRSANQLAGALDETASLKVQVEKVRRAAENEARGEIQHLAASVSELTRVNKLADTALATIRAQSDAAMQRANAEIAELKRQVDKTTAAAFDEACASLRVEHQQCASDLSQLSDLHDRSSLESATLVSTLRKEATEAQEELEKVKSGAAHQDDLIARANELDRLKKAATAANEGQASAMKQAEELKKTNAQLTAQVQQLQQPMELATAAAKAQGIKECEATQAELASTMQAASKEVDQLTKSLEAATRDAAAQAATTEGIRAEMKQEAQAQVATALQKAKDLEETAKVKEADALAKMAEAAAARASAVAEAAATADEKVKSLEREFSAQSAQQQQQVEKAHASELETQRQQLLKDQHELKERFEKEVKDLKAQASVGVAQAVANQEAAAEAAAKLEARLRAELAAAQEATEKVEASLSRKVEVTQATADALVNELRRELESAQAAHQNSTLAVEESQKAAAEAVAETEKSFEAKMQALLAEALSNATAAAEAARVEAAANATQLMESYAQQLNEANQSATLMSTQLEVVSREKVAVERDLKAKQDELADTKASLLAVVARDTSDKEARQAATAALEAHHATTLEQLKARAVAAEAIANQSSEETRLALKARDEQVNNLTSERDYLRGKVARTAASIEELELRAAADIEALQVKVNSSEALRVSAANAARGFRASLQNATDALAKQEASAANATSVAHELSAQVDDANSKLLKAEETIKGFKMELAHSRQAMQAGGEAAAAEARRTAKREAEEAAQANLAKARQQATKVMGEMADLEGELATAKKLLKEAVSELHDFKRHAEIDASVATQMHAELLHEAVANATAVARAAAFSEATISEERASASASCHSAPIPVETPVETKMNEQETDSLSMSQVDDLPAVAIQQNQNSPSAETISNTSTPAADASVEATTSVMANDVQKDVKVEASEDGDKVQREDVATADGPLANDNSQQPAATSTTAATASESSSDAVVVETADVASEPNTVPDIAAASRDEIIRQQPLVKDGEIEAPAAESSAKETTKAPISIGTTRKKNRAPISIGATTKKKSTPISIGSANKRKSAPIVFGSSNSKKTDAADTLVPTSTKSIDVPTSTISDSGKSNTALIPQKESKATASSAVEATTTESISTESKAEESLDGETDVAATEVAELSKDETVSTIKEEIEGIASDVTEPTKEHGSTAVALHEETDKATATETAELSSTGSEAAESSNTETMALVSEAADPVADSGASSPNLESAPLSSDISFSESPEILRQDANDETASLPLSKEGAVEGLIENQSPDETAAAEKGHVIEKESAEEDASAVTPEIETTVEHPEVEKANLLRTEGTTVDEGEEDEAVLLDSSIPESYRREQIESKGAEQKWWNKIRNKKNGEKAQPRKEQDEIKKTEKEGTSGVVDDVDWDAL